MSQVTLNQFYLFAIFMLNGILIGILFDIFRILRKSFNTPNIITYIEDSIFWILSALSVLYTLFVFNNGELRGYIFVGLLFGIILYMLFLSKHIIKISVTIIQFFKSIICGIFKVLSYPIKIIIKFINKIIAIPTRFVVKYLHNVTNYIKNLFSKPSQKSLKSHKIRLFNSKRKNLRNKEGF